MKNIATLLPTVGFTAAIIAAMGLGACSAENEASTAEEAFEIGPVQDVLVAFDCAGADNCFVLMRALQTLEIRELEARGMRGFWTEDGAGRVYRATWELNCEAALIATREVSDEMITVAREIWEEHADLPEFPVLEDGEMRCDGEPYMITYDPAAEHTPPAAGDEG